MRPPNLRLLLAALAVLTIVFGITASTEAEQQAVSSTPPAQETLAPENSCAHLYTTKDVAPLAKRAWTRAYGPRKAQISRYHGMLVCPKPGSRGYLKGTWHKAQKKYTHLRQMKRWKKACGDSNVLPCIHYAAGIYHQDYGHAEAVAYRESTLNPNICNSSDHCGLFQFDAGTFADCGVPGRGSDRLNPFWNSMCAMWYWANGEQSRWSQTY